jgi:F0F1-type ATP synthase membrane subunit b/b'
MEDSMERTTKIGMMVAGGLLLIGLVIVFVVKGKKDEKDRIQREHDQAVADFRGGIEKLDLRKAKDAETLLARLAEDAKLPAPLQNEDLVAKDVQSWKAMATGTLEGDKERQDLEKRLVVIEEVIKQADVKSSQELSEARLKLEEIDARKDAGGPELVERVVKARTAFDTGYARKLYSEAKTFRDSHKDQEKQALITHYSRAEDELLKLWQKAYRDKNKEVEPVLQNLYADVLRESDELSEKVFTEEVIDKTPWKNLITGELKNTWVGSEFEGFKWANTPDGLQIIAEKTKNRSSGLVTVGPVAGWRDFQLELEFTIEKGEAELILRVGKDATKAEALKLTTSGTDPLQTGKKYMATITVIGSRLRFVYRDGSPPDIVRQFHPSNSRKGQVGFVAHDGTRLTVHKLQIRELR